MTMYIGMDIHSKRSTYFAQDDRGGKIAAGEIETSQEGMEEMKRRVGGDHDVLVGLESGNMARYVVTAIHAIGWTPMVVDAREVRMKARRINQKSDQRDAWEICDGVRRGIYTTIVHVPAEPVERLRRLVSRRRHFVSLAASQVNAAKRLLRVEGVRLVTKSQVSETAWCKMLAVVEGKPELLACVKMHYEVWRAARRNVAQIDALMVKAAEPFEEDVRRLKTIPGVGIVTAITAIAVFSDVTRFATAKRAASYVGIVPQTYQSGECDRHGHITKRGSSELRMLLVESAHHASRATSPFHPYFARLCAKRGYKMAVVSVGHRLLRVMYAMLKHKTDFDLGKLNVVARVHQVTKTRYWEMKSQPKAEPAN